MAEDKNGFVLYADLINIVSTLPDETAGKLFKIILQYVNDLEVSIDDLILKIAFEPIKLQLKRDLKKYQNTKTQKRDAGNLGNLKKWHLDLYKSVLNNELTIDNALVIAKDRTAIKNIANIAVTVTDTVTDTVTVTDNGISDKTEEKPSPGLRQNNFKNSITDIDLLFQKVFLDTVFKNQFFNAGMPPDKLELWLENFNKFLKHGGTTHKDEKDYRYHFGNWVKDKDFINPEKYSLIKPKPVIKNQDQTFAQTQSPPLKRLN